MFKQLQQKIQNLDDETLKEANKSHNPNNISSKEMGNNINKMIKKELDKRG